eukprot:GHUV01046334.1.p1 GENE.GHUV01046334.1~~GHUV01046334.1.p1  ORF type:complete len:187 (-),score=24.82 GHUV01046334.1:32-592(-)
MRSPGCYIHTKAEVISLSQAMVQQSCDKHQPYPVLSISAACALRLGADSLLPALVRSLDAMKQPAARVSVMEFCVLFLGPGKVAGMPNTTGPLRYEMLWGLARGISTDIASIILLAAVATAGPACIDRSLLQKHGMHQSRYKACICYGSVGSGSARIYPCCWIRTPTCARWQPGPWQLCSALTLAR